MANSVEDGRRSARTLSIRVPSEDWPQIISGAACEFRLGVSSFEPLDLVPKPSLALLYRRMKAGGPSDRRLMTLTAVRRERLAAITEDGLRALGYAGPREDMLARFRRDWMIRARKRFEPLLPVVVCTVRNFVELDIEAAGEGLVRYLYEDALVEHERLARV